MDFLDQLNAVRSAIVQLQNKMNATGLTTQNDILALKDTDLSLASKKQLAELQAKVDSLLKAAGVDPTKPVTAITPFAETFASKKQLADLEAKVDSLINVVSWLQSYLKFVADFTGAEKSWKEMMAAFKNPTIPPNGNELPQDFTPPWKP